MDIIKALYKKTTFDDIAVRTMMAIIGTALIAAIARSREMHVEAVIVCIVTGLLIFANILFYLMYSDEIGGRKDEK